MGGDTWLGAGGGSSRHVRVAGGDSSLPLLEHLPGVDGALRDERRRLLREEEQTVEDGERRQVEGSCLTGGLRSRQTGRPRCRRCYAELTGVHSGLVRER